MALKLYSKFEINLFENKAMSGKELKSIKSRMGWQVGLQAATLFAIGATNNNIQRQTEIIGEKLDYLQNVTIEGFNDLTQAVNSLESTLISGIEDLKWILGSIDDKLGKIIGLIQYSGATESSEQFKIGLELYRQEFFEKSIINFNRAIESNPLNLNAKCGLYLAQKKINDSSNFELLIEVLKLIDSDFLYNIEHTQEVKERTTNYFINFCFSEFLINQNYELIIENYEKEIPNYAKAELSIKLKYINAIILSGRQYDDLLNEVISEGTLEKLLLYFNYDEKNQYIPIFLEDVLKSISSKLPDNSSLKLGDNLELVIEKKALLFQEEIRNNTDYILQFGFYETGLSSKISQIKTFYECASQAKSRYLTLNESILTAESNLKVVKNIALPVFYINQEQFLNEAFNQVKTDINKKIKNFITDSQNKLEKILRNDRSIQKSLEKDYPEFEDETENMVLVVRKFLKAINLKTKKIELDKIFS